MRAASSSSSSVQVSQQQPQQRRRRHSRIGLSSWLANSGLSRFCSLQEIGLTPPEQRRFRRINGLQLPLHPQQLLGWVLLVGIVAGTFVFLVPPLGPRLRPPALVILCSALLVHLVAHLSALLLDPAEPAVRSQPTDKLIPEFDRSKHLHVIENGRCHLCNIDASSGRTKHCSVCNKCVARFDHHCKWLNNCIGSRNYAAFLLCLISAITAALVVVAISVAEVSLVAETRFWPKKMDNVTLPLNLPLPGTGSLIVISIVGLLSAIAAILLIHLCFFHGYIAFMGVTTYEYVRNKHNKQIPSNGNGTGNGNAHGANEPEEIGNHHRRDDYFGASCLNRPSFCNKQHPAPLNMPAPMRYHFCESVDADQAARSDSRNIYICSTHTSTTTTAQITQQSNGNIATTTIQRSDMEKERRNFHLYFSYDAQFDQTSIELTSSAQTALNNGENQPTLEQIRQIQRFDRPQIELKPSTPSPVSCCFSIMGPSPSASLEKAKQRKIRQANAAGLTDTDFVDKKPVNARSCTAMRRLQMFLRARLRRSARHQRAINAETCSARKNKINPESPRYLNGKDNGSVRSITVESKEHVNIDAPVSPLPMVQHLQDQAQQQQQQQQPNLPKLPPLSLPPRHRLSNGEFVLADPNGLSIAKRNQPYLRVRRSSLGPKRPRFKVGPHLTQTAQLSPIPESELSKPASPRSPPLSHFTFPPLSSS